jgi:hypothetical protein
MPVKIYNFSPSGCLDNLMFISINELKNINHREGFNYDFFD